MRREATIKFGPRAPAWPAKIITRAIGWMTRTCRARRDLQALAALDGHHLRDIGLCRADVERSLPRDFLEATWKLW